MDYLQVHVTLTWCPGNLGHAKLTPLLRHNSIADAVADLERPEEIGLEFSGFQRFLYQPQVGERRGRLANWLLDGILDTLSEPFGPEFGKKVFDDEREGCVQEACARFLKQQRAYVHRIVSRSRSDPSVVAVYYQQEAQLVYDCIVEYGGCKNHRGWADLKDDKWYVGLNQAERRRAYAAFLRIREIVPEALARYVKRVADQEIKEVRPAIGGRFAFAIRRAEAWLMALAPYLFLFVGMPVACAMASKACEAFPELFLTFWLCHPLIALALLVSLVNECLTPAGVAGARFLMTWSAGACSVGIFMSAVLIPSEGFERDLRLAQVATLLMALCIPVLTHKIASLAVARRVQEKYRWEPQKYR